MATKTYNLDVAVLDWVERTARAEAKSQSEIVNEVLRTCIQEEGRKRRGRK